MKKVIQFLCAFALLSVAAGDTVFATRTKRNTRRDKNPSHTERAAISLRDYIAWAAAQRAAQAVLAETEGDDDFVGARGASGSKPKGFTLVDFMSKEDRERLGL